MITDATKDARNYDAQNLLDTITQTRDFLQKELAAAGDEDYTSKGATRLRLAISTAVKALAPRFNV